MKKRVGGGYRVPAAGLQIKHLELAGLGTGVAGRFHVVLARAFGAWLQL